MIKKRVGLFMVLALLVVALPVWAQKEVSFKDPAGDDNGSGAFVYPTDPVYKSGSFDITGFTVIDKGSTVELTVTVAANLENPWNMASGFSVQQAFVFIDMDGKEGSGHQFALPGLNAEFLPCCYWEKAVIMSPQPSSRVKTEVKMKAADMERDIIVPASVAPRGKSFTATIQKSDLGADVSAEWGFQVLMTSNEGFPEGNSILVRKLNEYEGQHRFGGGSDYDGDPNFLDMLVATGKGGGDEADLQHQVMSGWVSGDDPAQYVYVKLPMVYLNRAAAPAAAAPEPPAAPEAPAPAPAAPAAKAAKSDKFGLKITGQLFINFLHENDTTQGTNHTHGHNGVAPELELNLLAKVSNNVEVGARVQSRYRENYWATFWDMAVHNGNIERPGLFKLRGSWADVRTPEWLKGVVDKIHVGSSDLAMFSPYTIGRLRYIDRDNAAGLFLSGKPTKEISYELARISLPSLWAGPGWRTGGSDYDNQLYINKDYAYAGKIAFKPNNQYGVHLIAYHTSDLEVDPSDGNSRDGTDFTDRFKSTIWSVEADANPVDFLQLNGVYAHASTTYKAENYTKNWGGWNSMPAKDCSDGMFKVTALMQDPFKVGLNLSFEYFNIGEDYISIMASRREQDVLLTEGFEGDDVSGRWNAWSAGENWRYTQDWIGYEGNFAQTVSAIADNGETQYDEVPYESVIGWKGFTGIASFSKSGLDLNAEFTSIGYNSNGQGRDMDLYPVNARIWNQDQDRSSYIGLLRFKYSFKLGKPMDISGKVKLIHDEDSASTAAASDDYESKKWIYDLGLGCQVSDEIYAKIGYCIYDDGITYGGADLSSKKNKLYFLAKVEFAGLQVGYIADYATGNDWIGGVNYDDFKVVRSRAFVIVKF
ncbi:MAG TPA: glucodextranase DOMON-like domain-containing protein [Candidatus Aminicenantes bacterium]|nr:glucodextranase DOMON-like domain-containing protein [Candidatus Aminicenantes bacterium]